MTRAQAAVLLYKGLKFNKVVSPGSETGTGSNQVAGAVQITPSASSAQVDQTVQVTATVLNASGQPVVDAPVTFSVNGAAALGSSSAYTNGNRVAQTTVSDGTAETAEAAGGAGSISVQFETAGSNQYTLQAP
jgi:hypothetical protein